MNDLTTAGYDNGEKLRWTRAALEETLRELTLLCRGCPFANDLPTPADLEALYAWVRGAGGDPWELLDAPDQKQMGGNYVC